MFRNIVESKLDLTLHIIILSKFSPDFNANESKGTSGILSTHLHQRKMWTLSMFSELRKLIKRTYWWNDAVLDVLWSFLFDPSKL